MAKKKGNGDVKMRIAVIIIAISIVSYTVYHVSSLFGEEISTIITGISTETKTLSLESYIFRNEDILYSENGGIADYLVSDGTKVSKGDALAEVYANGIYKDKQTVRLRDSQIDILDQSVNSSLALADIEQVKEDTADSYYSVVRMLSTKDTGDLSKQIDSLLLGLNRESVLTNESSAVPTTLKNLVNTRDSLFGQGGGSVKEHTEDSGYFYSYVDGYEDYFTLDMLDAIESMSQVSALVSKGMNSDTSKAYGKLSESCEWKILVSVSSIDQAHFPDPEQSESESYYNVKFTENGNVNIPMLLEKKIEDKSSKGYLLVLSTDRLPDGFVFHRSQSIAIELSSVSGIYVPKTAVKREGNSLGVYILKGYVVHYRKIEPIYETENYYLADPDISGERYLGTNDLLITGGSNLFDGRILD